MHKQAWLIPIVLLFPVVSVSGAVVVSIDHLEQPSGYDNAGTIPFGQTFVAMAPNIAGMVVIIGDPNNPTGAQRPWMDPLALSYTTQPIQRIPLRSGARSSLARERLLAAR